MKYSETFLVGGEASKVILRSYKHKKVVVKTSEYGDVRKEAAALKLLAKNGIAVPRVRSVRNKAIFMDYIPGTNPQGSNISKATLLRNIAAAFNKLHTVRSNHLGELSKPLKNTSQNWIKFMHKRMKKGLQAMHALGFLNMKELKELERRAKELSDLGIRAFKPAIIHADLHLDNIRVTPEGEVFFLDFEGPFWGDELYDLAPFKYFHPKLYTKFRKAYSRHRFSHEKEAMCWYTFLHAIDIGAFDASIGKKKGVARALRIARSA
ncbi:MAG: Fructosamine kinase [Candidatus Parcubacteria bacterium]|jgi:fructosamine-3-kinase|nr:Fructosamine kinase [Candidatus Parcubacteria bacterium]